MAYTNPHASPYIYCLSNPINLIDPDGRKEYSYSEAAKNWDKFDSENDHIGLNEVSIVRQAPRYDQPYGQTITGGIGDGVETTSKYKGPSIDASQFSYPFGGGTKSIGEFFYNFLSKTLSLKNPFTFKIDGRNNKTQEELIVPKTNYQDVIYETKISGNCTINGKNYKYTTFDGIKVPEHDTIYHKKHTIMRNSEHNIIDTLKSEVLYDVRNKE